MSKTTSYVIDCTACRAGSAACDDCLMSFIDDPAYGQPVRFSEEERAALGIMAEVGLIPQLRLVG
ncbi:MAG: hypothetical protein LBI33_11780 [Propionibacteriaceae bacterium]|jgi:hypothetical protein|nr:hypothetical protein [Propionibacteriaceae bacterium]